mmetsp:Transcript_4357/g.12106  ORF Transcript_4357/g.12106 Transcript_4357/m.12106 type:complete len:271 (-) Transcript_4357:168-980(-)
MAAAAATPTSEAATIRGGHREVEATGRCLAAEPGDGGPSLRTGSIMRSGSQCHASKGPLTSPVPAPLPAEPPQRPAPGALISAPSCDLRPEPSPGDLLLVVWQKSEVDPFVFIRNEWAARATPRLSTTIGGFFGPVGRPGSPSRPGRPGWAKPAGMGRLGCLGNSGSTDRPGSIRACPHGPGDRAGVLALQARPTQSGRTGWPFPKSRLGRPGMACRSDRGAPAQPARPGPLVAVGRACRAGLTAWVWPGRPLPSLAAGQARLADPFQTG